MWYTMVKQEPKMPHYTFQAVPSKRSIEQIQDDEQPMKRFKCMQHIEQEKELEKMKVVIEKVRTKVDTSNVAWLMGHRCMLGSTISKITFPERLSATSRVK
jgi:hypothetical protein